MRPAGVRDDASTGPGPGTEEVRAVIDKDHIKAERPFVVTHQQKTHFSANTEPSNTGCTAIVPVACTERANRVTGTLFVVASDIIFHPKTLTNTVHAGTLRAEVHRKNLFPRGPRSPTFQRNLSSTTPTDVDERLLRKERSK